MRASYLGPPTAGMLTGMALFFLVREFPNLSICVITFFLVGVVISLLPPYTMYEPSKMFRRKSGPADEVNPREGLKALVFMIFSILGYLLCMPLFQ